MLKSAVIFLLLIPLLYKSDYPVLSPASNHTMHIAIQPLGKVDAMLLQHLQHALSEELNAIIKILPAKEIPSLAWYEPRKRYLADRLMVWLQQNKPDDAEHVLGVTAADISIAVKGKNNWGIMGLGYQPGSSCVVSGFRPAKNCADKNIFFRRMQVLCFHELGHNFSLPHCSDQNCIMQDAQGKNRLDSSKWYCKSCSKTLLKKGFLKAIKQRD